jgi:hypothetical protein
MRRSEALVLERQEPGVQRLVEPARGAGLDRADERGRRLGERGDGDDRRPGFR